ncbi:MAG: penicillin-binding protein activator [Bdellovibrio bacteriovorus]
MQQNRAIPRRRRLIWAPAAAGLALVLSGCTNLPFGEEAGAGVRGGFRAGDQVALLLPAAGPYLGVSDAVRDGIRAAASVDDGSRPKLVPVDSGAPERVAANLGQAIEAGATHVIGPIDKPSVDALAAAGAIKVPTLALNEGTSAGRPAPNLFQFALSPESDAIEVANKAKSLGFTRALMLYPDDGAGKRRAEAFRNQWGRLSGTLAGEASFAPGTPGVPASLQRLLGRDGADFLFLAANAEQARILYPQIRKGAADLPVIATSDVYPGDADAARDRALAGLYFVDMPWMLGLEHGNDPLRRADLKSSASHLATPLGRRLYAMGIDAYRLVPRLTTLADNPGASFPGKTGRLSIDPLGRVRRQLFLARFTESGPEPVAGIESSARASKPRNPRPEPAGRGQG